MQRFDIILHHIYMRNRNCIDEKKHAFCKNLFYQKI